MAKNWIRGKDKREHPYIEIEMEGKTRIRITYKNDDWYDKNEHSVKIQIRMPDGKLRQGPELPDEFIEKIVDAINELRKTGK